MKLKKVQLNTAVCCTLFALANIASPGGTSSGVDLGIGRGLDTRRPNILVAWRNTEKILEIEVLVRNLGDRPGRGKLSVEICDDEGRTLLSTEPYPITVPAKHEGGDEGAVVQSKGFRLMNLMFDQLDRLHQRYKLRARIETEGPDLNPLDNIACKTFNVDGRAMPDSIGFYRYRFANPTDAPLKVALSIDHTPAPAGWIVEASPKSGQTVTLGPKQVFTGHLMVKTPKEVVDGQHIDFQVSLVGSKGGKSYTIDQDEWYLVAASKPPEMAKPTVTLQPDGTLAVNTVAFDPVCGIKEASGMQVAYSLDRGTTFSTRVLAYTRGNFYNKTWFEAILGPFAPGSEVVCVVTAENNAGLIRRVELDPISIPRTPPVPARIKTSAR